jgi:hypothetical protein
MFSCTSQKISTAEPDVLIFCFVASLQPATEPHFHALVNSFNMPYRLQISAILAIPKILFAAGPQP